MTECESLKELVFSIFKKSIFFFDIGNLSAGKKNRDFLFYFFHKEIFFRSLRKKSSDFLSDKVNVHEGIKIPN